MSRSSLYAFAPDLPLNYPSHFILTQPRTSSSHSPYSPPTRPTPISRPEASSSPVTASVASATSVPWARRLAFCRKLLQDVPLTFPKSPFLLSSLAFSQPSPVPVSPDWSFKTSRISRIQLPEPRRASSGSIEKLCSNSPGVLFQYHAKESQSSVYMLFPLARPMLIPRRFYSKTVIVHVLGQSHDEPRYTHGLLNTMQEPSSSIPVCRHKRLGKRWTPYRPFLRIIAHLDIAFTPHNSTACSGGTYFRSAQISVMALVYTYYRVTLDTSYSPPAREVLPHRPLQRSCNGDWEFTASGIYESHRRFDPKASKTIEY